MSAIRQHRRGTQSLRISADAEPLSQFSNRRYTLRYMPMENDTQVWANKRLRFLVTPACNLSCVYCHNEGQPKGRLVMSDEMCQHVVRMVKAVGTRLRSVSFSGGEPLLHPDLEDFVSRFREVSDQQTVITNGLLLGPQRLDSLITAGISKFRLGVDSLSAAKSRPSPNYPPGANIHNVLDLLLERRASFELNVVLTEFNREEIAEFVAYCQRKRVSAKFFEHVAVDANAGDAGFLNSFSDPSLSESEFWEACRRVIPDLLSHPCPEIGIANTVAECDGFSLRYCRYLCDYRLCYLTGTRIDARGLIYTCMAEKGAGAIRAGEPLETSIATARQALRLGCVRSRDDLALNP